MQGGQPQYVRVPMADGTLVPLPEGIAGDEHDARVLPLTEGHRAGRPSRRPPRGRAGAGGDAPVSTRDGDGLADMIGGLTDGHGPEAVIDAVSGAESMKQAVETVQAGGTVSWVGMGGLPGPVDRPWDACFLRNLTIRGGVAPVRRYLPEMFVLLERGGA